MKILPLNHDRIEDQVPAVACELVGVGGLSSEMTDSVASNDSLINFFLHVLQIFVPMELFHTSGYDRSETFFMTTPGMARWVWVQ